MTLLRSNAQHIFWLGRYLMRMQFMCQYLPFQEDAVAIEIAHAFSLPAYDAASLNHLLFNAEQPYSLIAQMQLARDNVLELRGILTAKTYAQLNLHIKNAMLNPTTQMCQVVAQCMQIFEAEKAILAMFFNLGIHLEQLDASLRMSTDNAQIILALQTILQQLAPFASNGLLDTLQVLSVEQSFNQFYQFSSQLQEQFEANV